ncbi:DMT family transporter [Paenactinomyces guangxiensis]|uniref:DMT family transporter n=1 Tax=Paenactinomyces guangxiensis TaxID=1490290 RepID=A0A7W2A7G4_9BACL|nr:DMT family transporter [Paenactinomyces guangxiensis]MBA4492768.1 DMT family transporter [Paenactinomyces guangxiensis]MBH8590383.1 DMT family transporter [Paenactinomyces guangxiensis]
MRRESLFLIALGVGVTAVSFSAIFIKWSQAPAGVLGMYRLLFTVVLLTPWIWRMRHEMYRLSGKEWWLLVSSGFFLGLHFLGWMGSLRYTSVASSMILLNLGPLFVMIGAYLFFKEKLRWQALIGMMIAFTGTAMIAGMDIELGPTALWGDFLSIFGALTVAIHMLIGQKLRMNISFLVYSYIVFIVAGLVLAAFNVVSGVPLLDYPAREWGLFLLLAIVPTIFGHLLFNWLLQYVKAITIQVAILGEPVGAIVLAYFLLGEKVTLIQGVGGFLSICGIAWFIRVKDAAGVRQVENEWQEAG